MYKPAALVHHSVSTVSYTPCTGPSSLCMPADQRVEIGCGFKGKAVFPHTSDVTVQRTFLLNFTRETVFVLIKFERSCHVFCLHAGCCLGLCILRTTLTKLSRPKMLRNM